MYMHICSRILLGIKNMIVSKINYLISSLLCVLFVFGSLFLFIKGCHDYEYQCGIEASHNLIYHNPWLVFIEYYKDDDYIDIRCGATLIGRRHVITAAHCVDRFSKLRNSRLVVRLGEYNVISDKDCVGGICADPIVRIEVSEIIVHSLYNGMENDIAMLKLTEDAPYTDFIRPICLPTPNTNPDMTFVASGWGENVNTGSYSATKKIILLPLWKTEDCIQRYKHTVLPKKVICAGGEDGIDTCRGDSGGPLALVRDKVELWGITSQGSIHCGLKGAPGIYTSVRDHYDWIQEVINT